MSCRAFVTAVIFACVAAGSAAELVPGMGVFVNDDGTIGLTANFAQPTKQWTQSRTTKVALGYSLDAVFGSKTESLPNHLYGGLDLRMQLLDRPWENWTFNVILPNAQMEATQNMTAADLALSGQLMLTGAHPLNFIFNILKDSGERLLGANPSSLTFSFAKISRAEGADTLGPGWKSRIGSDLLLTAPLKRNLVVSLRWQTFNEPGDAFKFNTWKQMTECAATFRWEGGQWMHVKYAWGGLPPLYEPSRKWDIGAGFSFD